MTYQNLSILVVDDDKEITKGTVLLLRKLGASALGAYGITEAKTFIKSNKFNIAIIDLNMDPIERTETRSVGFQLLDYLKEESPSTYRIVRSVYHKADVYLKLFGMADSYVRKGFRSDRDLTEVIDKYIEDCNNKKIGDDVISCGSLAYNYDNRTFFLFGNPVSELLTKAQMDLLLHLLENQNIYCSKHNLQKSLLSTGSSRDDVDDVPVHISAIRSKFKKLNYTDFIINKQNVGYKIVPGRDIREKRDAT